MRSQAIVIIPAYNEESTVEQVVTDVRTQGLEHVVVVDDGSEDQTANVAKASGATVLRRNINRGMGAATQRGIEYGLAHGFEYFLTIDADAQQRAEDLLVVLKSLSSHKCVLGSRFLQKNIIPFDRRVANKIANWVTGVLFNVWVTDSQTGLRGFTRKVANELSLHSDGFEYATEFLSEVREMKVEIYEIPIHVSYSSYSLGKGQGFWEGMRTLKKLIRKAWGNN